ncbi:hypothetical protein Lser_V15G20874 [Lactuca serriola]
MSSQDNNGLPYSFGNGFPLPSEDDFPHSDKCESMFPSSSNAGNGHHASPTLLPPPPPPMTLPTSLFSQVERYETTQALLACKYQDGNSMCTDVLEMKSYIEKLDIMGVIFPREQAIDLVLILLPKSYGQFIESFRMRNINITLIDMNQMLIVAEAKMLKITSEANESDSKVSMEIENGDNHGPKKLLFPMERDRPRSNYLIVW